MSDCSLDTVYKYYVFCLSIAVNACNYYMFRLFESIQSTFRSDAQRKLESQRLPQTSEIQLKSLPIIRLSYFLKWFKPCNVITSFILPSNVSSFIEIIVLIFFHDTTSHIFCLHTSLMTIQRKIFILKQYWLVNFVRELVFHLYTTLLKVVVPI